MKNEIIGIVKESINIHAIIDIKSECAILDSGAFDHAAEYAAYKIIEMLRSCKVEKFLFVEDGSVDLDDLKQSVAANPEIKIVVYRQGGRVPQLVEVKE